MCNFFSHQEFSLFLKPNINMFLISWHHDRWFRDFSPMSWIKHRFFMDNVVCNCKMLSDSDFWFLKFSVSCILDGATFKFVKHKYHHYLFIYFIFCINVRKRWSLYSHKCKLVIIFLYYLWKWQQNVPFVCKSVVMLYNELK